MPAWLLPAITAGASIFSGLSAKKGQEKANEDEMAFNAAEAEKNRAFQREMSDTAHQREVKDLIAAGLNPLLSVNHGATTPGGSAAQAALRSTTSESSARFAETARQVAEVALNRQMADKIKAETVSAKAQAAIDKQMAEMSTSAPGKIMAWIRMAMGTGLPGGWAAASGARKVAEAIGRARIYR